MAAVNRIERFDARPSRADRPVDNARWTLLGAAVLTAAVFIRGAGVDGQEAPADAQTGVDLPVVEHQLSNGMLFLILPRSGAPIVSFVVQYPVGSVNEVPGTTGIAHFLEHLLFKGTTTLGTLDFEAEQRLFRRIDAVHDTVLALEEAGAPPEELDSRRERIARLEAEASVYAVSNEFDRILSRNGARGLNARTDAESTAYFVEMPSNRAELWFLLESERMRHPVFREFYSERDVIAEERRLRVETQPAGLLHEAHLAEAFRVHPYGRPVVGFMRDIQRLDRRRVREFHNRYYGPDNAVVAIVGNADPERVIEWADRYFGDLEPAGPPPSPPDPEPPQEAGRSVEVAFDAEPAVRIGWRVPEERHPDAAALSVLSSLLTGGSTSRLYRRLVVRERLATFVTSVMGPGVRFPRLFTIEATPRFPHGTESAAQAVYAELDSLRRTPPAESELRHIRNQIEAGQVRGLTSQLGLAFQLAGSAATYGDWRAVFQLRERLAEVTPEDVSRVVDTYFDPRNRTVATLVRPAPGPVR